MKPNINSRKLKAVFLLIGFCFAASSAHAKDFQAERIVALAPSLAEVAAEILGSGLERIVGVSEYTDFPPSLQKTTSIGPYHHFNLEKVVSLKPDLVLATEEGNSKDQVVHLKQLGLNVVTVKTQNLADILQSIRAIGKAMGHEEKGKLIATQVERGVDRLAAQSTQRIQPEKPTQRKKLSVFLQLSEEPVITVGKFSYLTDILSRLGAENVYRELPASYPRPSLENVLAKDPDVIIVLALGKDKVIFEKMASHWKKFEKLKAVKNKKVWILSSDELLRPSTRLLEGMSRLKKILDESHTEKM